jgi:mannose-1-phosphate guanylyltransferase
MTVDRNKNIANKVMVVGNIDNRHLEKVLEKITFLYWYYRINSQNTACCNCIRCFCFNRGYSNHNAIGSLLAMLTYMKKLSRSHWKSKQWFYCNLGIVPTKPETGYGWWRKGDSVPEKKKPSYGYGFYRERKFFCGIAECFVSKLACS